MTQSRNRHIIKKQIFEVEVSGQEKAWEIQQKLAEIFQQEVLPALNQALNKISPPNVIHRIDNLTINLGEVRLEHLEQDVAQAVNNALEQTFNQALPETKIHPNEILRQIDDLTLEDDQLAALEKAWLQKLKLNFRKLLKDGQNNSSLAEILAKLDALETSNKLEKKLLNQFKNQLKSKWTDNNSLEELLGNSHLSEIEKGLAQKLKLTFKQALLDSGAHQLPAILQLVDDLAVDTLDDIEADLLQKLKLALKNQLQQKWGNNQASTSMTELLIYFLDTGRLPWWAKPSPRLLEQSLENALASHPLWLIEQFKKYSRHSNYRKRIINTFNNDDLLGLSQKVLTTSDVQFIQKLTDKLPGLAQKTSLAPTLLRFIFWEQILLTYTEPTTSERFTPLFLQNFSLELTNRTHQKELNQLLKDTLQIDWPSDLKLASATTTKQPEEPQAPIQKQFSQSEEIYVDNAGLVLLWIFISNFFKNLDWLEDKTFKAQSLQHRATWMLQFLVNSQTQFPEYDLPLNKLLCGLGTNESLEPLDDLTEVEQAAGNELLEVVLNYTQGLGNLSKEGFQQAYLQREGVLTRQNNGYLLQVEKETFDILLTRLEWTYQVVKLPWMDKAIFVEW